MKFATILAAAAVLAMASCMMADEPTSKPTTKPYDRFRAKVVKVDGTNLIVTVHHRGEDAKEVTVKTDDKTVVVIDQEEAKLADLKEGMNVLVTPKEGTATRIAAWTKSATSKPAATPSK
jgi:Cu/Ag efflux protein CusF